MNIRDPNLPVNLTAFRALQDEVARLDAEIARLRELVALGRFDYDAGDRTHVLLQLAEVPRA